MIYLAREEMRRVSGPWPSDHSFSHLLSNKHPNPSHLAPDTQAIGLN